MMFFHKELMREMNSAQINDLNEAIQDIAKEAEHLK